MSNGLLNRTIYAEDCFKVLTNGTIPDKSIDLIYLDPPFDSKSDYNLPFKGKYKKDVKPVMAFKDTWSWSEEENENLFKLRGGGVQDQLLADIVDLSKRVFQERPNAEISTSAYLLNMAIRLKPMRHLLKDTGSIYLHCNPAAGHYLKMIMDVIFGKRNFRNEIIWHYGKWTNETKSFQKNHDIVFYYSKEEKKYLFNKQYDDINQRDHYKKGYHTNVLSDGTRQLIVYDAIKAKKKIASNKYDKIVLREGQKKVALPDVWDIPIINPMAKERLGYPTQKPLALLERIIKASSNEEDIVLDPFCGCGTTVHAAEMLHRKWLGIDISQFSAGLIRNRITGNFKYLDRTDINVFGCPLELIHAQDLAKSSPFEFEKWACGAVGAQGLFHNPGERGADGGVDGIIPFYTSPRVLGSNKDDIEKTFAVVQVKGGKVTPDSVKALSTTVRESGGKCGIMVCFEKYMNTVENNREKIYVEDWEIGKYNFIQGLSVEDLIKGKMPKIPSARFAS